MINDCEDARSVRRVRCPTAHHEVPAVVLSLLVRDLP